MKRAVIFWALLCLLPACFSSGEDEALRDLTQAQVRMLDDQVKGLDQNHADLASQLNALQASLNEMNGELTRVDARLVAARGCNKYLAELSTVGFGPSAGRWTLENPVLPARVLMMFGLAVALCWVLYRMQLRRGESEALVEVDRVLQRINFAPPPPPPMAAVVAPPAPAPEPEAGPEPAPPANFKPVAPAPVIPDPPPVPAPAPVAPTKESGPEAADPPDPAGPKEEPPAEKSAKRAVAKREVRRKPVNRSQAKKCKVPGCPNKHRSKGYCNKHYQQWRRGGSIEGDSEE